MHEFLMEVCRGTVIKFLKLQGEVDKLQKIVKSNVSLQNFLPLH